MTHKYSQSFCNYIYMNSYFTKYIFSTLTLLLIILTSSLITACQSRSDSPPSHNVDQLSPLDISLVQAIKDGHLHLVRQALDNGANPNRVHRYQGSTVTPLLLAAAHGANDIYQLLLTRGADEKFSYKRFTSREIRTYVNSGVSTSLSSGGEQ